MRMAMRCGWSFVGLLVLTLETAVAQSTRAERTLVDPGTHLRWTLQANPVHPGGPGTLVLLPAAQAPAVSAPQHAVLPRVVIHAGDRLLVEEATPFLVARYAAVALAPAATGTVFFARFIAGMKPVRVVALGPGRASLIATAALEGQQ